MALDEPRDEDSEHRVDGITFVIGPEDSDYVLAGGGVKVDRTRGIFGSGFYVYQQASARAGRC